MEQLSRLQLTFSSIKTSSFSRDKPNLSKKVLIQLIAKIGKSKLRKTPYFGVPCKIWGKYRNCVFAGVISKRCDF